MTENDHTEKPATNAIPRPASSTDIDRLALVAQFADLATRLVAAERRTAELQHRLDAAQTTRHVVQLICYTALLLGGLALLAISAVVGVA